MLPVMVTGSMLLVARRLLISPRSGSLQSPVPVYKVTGQDTDLTIHLRSQLWKNA